MALHVVTGAFGFCGKYLTRRLLAAGHTVRTLTASPERANEFAGRVEVRPFTWEDPAALVGSLRGAAVLHNTYWVRFNHRSFSYAQAVARTQALFAAARAAGVGRVVHISITNADEQSRFEYFAGKGRLERDLRESGLSHAILRPGVLFGPEDVLVNNMAWMIRRLPVIGVFGRGDYRLQPIFVDDLAALMERHAAGDQNVTVDAIGPETFTYRELLRTIARALGRRRLIVGVPAWLGLLVARVLGVVLNDVVLTRDEVYGLMADLLYCPGSPPAGETKLSEWVAANAEMVGHRYANELQRRRDRRVAY